jgi:hypothetical protein
MSDTDTAAPTAHDQMMDMVFKGDAAGAQAMSAQVNREAGIEQPQVGHDPLALAPMPDAPRAEVGEVDRAVAILTEHGGEHAALVQEWKQSGANIGEELAYAKAAFRDIVANRPDLIAKVDASGLGNDPAVLKLLAQHGRLQAGMTGDFTVARNGSSPSVAPAISRGGGGSKAALLAELAQIRENNPVGSASYKKPAVQNRITQINEALYGNEPVVGQGGRTA